MRPTLTWLILLAAVIGSKNSAAGNDQNNVSKGSENDIIHETTTQSILNATTTEANATATTEKPSKQPETGSDQISDSDHTSIIKELNNRILPAKQLLKEYDELQNRKNQRNISHTADDILQPQGKNSSKQHKILESASVKVLIAEGEAVSVHDMKSFRRQRPWIYTSSRAYSVDYHWNKSLVFYAADNKIYRGHVNESSRQVVTDVEVIVDIEVETPVSLAVDWVHDKLYWMSVPLQLVEMADLDGTNRRLLWDNLPPFVYPNNIAVDPYEGYVFFLNHYAVFRSKLNGSNMVMLNIIDNKEGQVLRGVRCLALDRENKQVFITGKHAVMEAENRTTLYVYIDHVSYEGGKPDPLLGLDDKWNDVFAMDVLGDTLYFADYEHINEGIPDKLYSAPLSGGQFNATARWVPQHGRSGIWGIRAYHPCAQNHCKPSTL